MLKTLYKWYGRKVTIAVLTTIVILLVFALYSTTDSENNDDKPSDQTELATRSVQVANAGEFMSESARTYIGTIDARNRVTVETESGGRAVSVPVRLGQRVSAGQVLVSLEASNEQVAVSQARAALEAVKAGALQSDSGVREAEVAVSSAQEQAVLVMQESYTLTRRILNDTLDSFYSNPDSPLIGLRINSFGQTTFLNNERREIGQMLPEWQSRIGQNMDTESLLLDIEQTISRLERIKSLIDTFINLVENQPRDFTLAGRPIEQYSAELLSIRSTLNNQIRNLQGARTGINQAESALARARIGGTESETSLAQAQIRQAEATLEAAQVRLAKRVITSPITGTVQELNVQTGQFVNAFSPIVEIINEDAFEVTVFVTEQDLAKIEIGRTVTINETDTGVITNIAPAIDQRTRRVKVIIATESSNLTAGKNVRVSFASTTDREPSIDEVVSIRVPIRSVSFSGTDASVFTLNDEGVIRSIPVTLGEISGSTVTVSSDELSAETQIITDVRGLSVGQTVRVIE